MVAPGEADRTAVLPGAKNGVVARNGARIEPLLSAYRVGRACADRGRQPGGDGATGQWLAGTHGSLYVPDRTTTSKTKGPGGNRLPAPFLNESGRPNARIAAVEWMMPFPPPGGNLALPKRQRFRQRGSNLIFSIVPIRLQIKRVLFQQPISCRRRWRAWRPPGSRWRAR
jgi:hypothetical protein